MPDPSGSVHLPDRAVPPAAHPLDLPAARGPFRRAQLLATLTSPAVGLSVSAILWFGSGSNLPPLLAGVAIVGVGGVAARAARERAWALIPRERQDRDRVLPLLWELGSAVAVAVVLAAALVLLVARLGRSDVPLGFREFMVGAGVGVVLLSGADILTALLRGRSRRAVLEVPRLLAVAGGLAGAAATRLAGPGPWLSSSTVVLAAMLMLGVGAALVLGRYLGSRRRPSRAAAS